MFSYHSFNSFGVAFKLLHILRCHHYYDVIKKHLLILAPQIITQLLGFDKTVLQVLVDDIGSVPRLYRLFLGLQLICPH